jgi:hypothetical protein
VNPLLATVAFTLLMRLEPIAALKPEDNFSFESTSPRFDHSLGNRETSEVVSQ